MCIMAALDGKSSKPQSSSKKLKIRFDDDDTTASVPPVSKREIRRADYQDVEKIEELFTPDIEQMYNLDNAFDPIHKCYYSLIIKNVNQKLVGALCLADYPNVPAIPSDEWSSWASRIYGIRDLSSYNTFWVHLAAFHTDYAYTFLQPLLQHVFEQNAKKNYVIFVIPCNCNDYISWLEEYSTLILPINYTNPNRVQTLRLLARQNFITNYKIRRAVEEDNDDLVPLIDRYSKRLRELYGDFYIAELITRHPNAGRHLIVAEYKGLAVSVLCLNENVNYDELNTAFDLHAFCYLCKPDKMETVQNLVRKDSSTISTLVPPRDRTDTRATQLSKISLIANTTITNKASHSSVSQVSLSGLPSQLISDESFLDDLLFPLISADALSTYSSNDEFHDEEFDPIHEESLISMSGFDSRSYVSYGSYADFEGKPNAFVIEIAAAEEEHQFSLWLLLEASFECFPTRDYCILTVPSDHNHFPLLKHFVHVTPKPNSIHPHELYVFNKHTLNVIRVKIAAERDGHLIKNFVKCVKFSDNIYDRFMEAQSNPKSKLVTCLVFSGNNSLPVGLAMVNELTDMNHVEQRYALRIWTNMRRERNEDIGFVEMFCISPIFQRHIDFILREIHRKCNYSTLFYGINRYDTMDHRVRPLPSFIRNVYPVPPRKIVTAGRHDRREDYPEEPFSLYISTPKLTQTPTFDVNRKIVVIGASYTSIAFLRGLLFSSDRSMYAIFNNVTIVSSSGLCHHKHPNRLWDLLLAKSSTIDYDYMEKINLRTYVNIVTGTMTAINRRQKTITVNKRYVIPYDLLFIMCGLQYSLPRKDNSKDYLNMRLPPNMFTVNSESDAITALYKLKKIFQSQYSSKHKLIIYGHNIDAYCCVQAMLEFGVPGSQIVLIEPEPENHEFVFSDGDIYEAVIDQVKECGVEINYGYTIVDWWQTTPDVVTVKFESILRVIEIEALGVFLYGDKCVNVKMFNAIFQAGLVFDGRLVITPDCRTNDPYIYAAGTITKYSRRYYADHLLHKYFNHEEIGQQLGRRVRGELLPYMEVYEQEVNFWEYCWADATKVVPVYEKPLITYAILPGNLYYLHVCKPGKQVPLEAAMTDDDYGSVLLTGSCKSLATQGYFRMHLNVANMVETITCLSLHELDYKKLILLWGKHESLLNNLMKRFEVIYITDLFEFFEKPWCTAIFHDDFPLYEEDVLRILMTKLKNVPTTPLEEIVRIYFANSFKNMTEEQKSYLWSTFRDTPYDTMIQDQLLRFIKDNIQSLDMYAHPIKINVILQDFMESPLFKPS